MGDLKVSDVSGKVGDPEDFKQLSMGFNDISEKTIDVHKDDDIDEIMEVYEDFVGRWEGFFTQL